MSDGSFRDGRALPFGTWDGHLHTAFARHGADPTETTKGFARRAQALGFHRVTFTEHPLFPLDRIPRSLHQGIYLDTAALDQYVRTVTRLRQELEGAIEVRLGFEVDYVPGDPDFPLGYLDRYLPAVRDAVLSVHFLPANGEPASGALGALDVTPEAFCATFLRGRETLDGVRGLYWDTVEEAVLRVRSWNTGIFWRVGHLDVVGKFAAALPTFDADRDRQRAFRVLARIHEAGFGLDVNASGLDVPLRREAYPTADFLAAAVRLGVPLVYGSDAHRISDIGRHREALAAQVALLGTPGTASAKVM